jgi:hypothetical protein
MRIELSPPREEEVAPFGAANRVIGVINGAEKLTEELAGVVRLVGGIAAQLSSNDLSPIRRETLETEARAAIAAIQDRSFPPPAAPLGGSLDETVRSELERTLGRTLEFLLPEQLKSDLPLGQIDFSTKEAILRTQTSIEVARQRIAQIQSGLDESRVVVEGLIQTAEVAAENRRAAGSSVRALDEAVELVGAMQLSLAVDPAEALGSIGALTPRALRVLSEPAR